ncbi:hypothetical protein KP509_30G059300 [Ceratopteris richardii]|uniref:DJ-1/PfpI domain-containing protein n=1 Tax=Ceratopteris richardii TaxID=49495 RepID=A0A8T2R520_CERRI|nr:hypothetical protein KP509_30G059300 [Ceratopteris richardii]KAH7290685.1 hypothetical protein KP509_30G059300 [Ceratopteris richardii]
MAGKRVLFLCTSHAALGDTGKSTGVWAEEVAAPYYILKEAGCHIDIASIKGGKIPLDPESLEGNLNDHTHSFLKDHHGLKSKVESSLSIDEASEDYDAVFLPGGHGVCYDFPDNPALITLLEKFWAEGKVVASVCHGPVGFVNIKAPDGEYIVKGKKVTGFTNSEEDAVGKTAFVPFLLEDKLKERGAHFERANDWNPYAVADGKLITGQNPMSSEKLAKLILEAL